jgi:16S rRNA (cytidine1402-2'-O)-methyltransferase
MNSPQERLSAGLYLVATPIGAARDITLRALDVLAGADVIAAEDTRTARKLMDIHAIQLGGRRLVAFHDHSDRATAARLVEEVKHGRSVAYVSEAGTPLVSDPGYELVREAIAQSVQVVAVPGASAVLAGLAVAGLPTDRFMFAGFLPAQAAARATAIAGLRGVDATLVIYESPRRLGATLADLAQGLGGARPAVMARELTKRFEEVVRGSLDELAARYAQDEVKGEVVLMVGRAGAEETDAGTVRAALAEAMKTMRVKDAATAVAGATGLPRREVYQIALGLEKDGGR